jgi:hypothetical protein
VADAEQVKEAAEAYIYGYPLVYDLREGAENAEGGGSLPLQAPYNSFAYARRLLGPETKFVSPNNDTLYVIGQCDVRQGPLVLHVPDTDDRYYVLQFVDAWTNNFAYIGRRATGTAEAEYLLTEPAYDGPVPDGMTVVAAPTGVFSIIGRVQVDGEADLPAVHALQNQFTLTPLAVHQGGATPPAVAGVPEPDPRVREDLAWWERFRVALATFPPPDGDASFLALAERFGATATESPSVDPDPGLAEVLVAGQQAGQAKIEGLAGQGGADAVNGWTSALHLFDYNLDRLGLGTIDDPEWNIPDRQRAYVSRAVAARGGLWGNHGYEANYAFVWTDADGQPLDGANRYELRLEQLPPVDAFWSLTMYDVPDFYLVANPIDRYSIGDRTPGTPDRRGRLGDHLHADRYSRSRQGSQLAAHAGRCLPPGHAHVPAPAGGPGRDLPPATGPQSRIAEPDGRCPLSRAQSAVGIWTLLRGADSLSGLGSWWRWWTGRQGAGGMLRLTRNRLSGS